jgi:hypothetical protein
VTQAEVEGSLLGRAARVADADLGADRDADGGAARLHARELAAERVPVGEGACGVP